MTRMPWWTVPLVLVAACSKPAATAPATSDPHAGHGGAASSHAAHVPEGYAPVQLAPDRVQLFGVRTETARRRDLTREVRTVGVVRTDETRESHVHVKWNGWIEQFFVAFVGQQVSQGDPLFAVYSPELLTAEQELVVAAKRASAARAAGRTADIESADLLLDTARRKLQLWDVPDDVITQVQSSGEAQRLITVRAPRSGTVVEKMALPGMYVEPPMDLYTVADLSAVWVLADLYEYEIAAVAVGQTASIALVGAAPDQPALAATVAFVAPTVDPMTRTVKVRFTVPNELGSLRPGAYATVRLQVPLGEALAIPSDAVIDTGERKIAFVRTGEGAFEPRALTVGVRAGDEVEVLAGLSEGEEVVTRAQFMLDSESRLRAASGSGVAGHRGH